MVSLVMRRTKRYNKKWFFVPGKEGKGLYCRVIVDIVHENVAKPFTYLMSEGMELGTGQRVAGPV